MSELLVERTDDVVTLTLNRPDKMNALSAILVEGLLEEVERAAATDTRLLVLRGNGRNFSAGFDFSEFEVQSEGDLVLRFVRIEMLLQALYHAPYDTIALAHGRNFGAGVDLICSCSRRIADEGARFMMPGLRFGLLLGTRRYAERVGRTAARRVLQEGTVFGSQEALDAHFLTKMEPQDRWPELLASAKTGSTQLTIDAQARLFSATSMESRACDLADLVKSAAAPGLKQRIQAYRAGQKRKESTE